MEKIIINENLIQYRIIESMDRVTYFTSAFLYHENGKGVLIDSGYRRMGQFILEDLQRSNVKLEYIIVTHYHKDHAEGSTVFSEIPIIASDAYSKTLERLKKVSDFVYETPKILVEDFISITINTSKVEIYKTPGHTNCGLTVCINDVYLYVSDNLLEDIDNKIIIPYLDLNADPVEHLELLEKYKEIQYDVLLLTHGLVKKYPNKSLEIDERVFYLDQFIKSDYQAELSECLLKDISNYSMTSIHKLNQRNARKKRVSSANQNN